MAAADPDAEIAALREAAARSDARLERIPDPRWPGGARIAVNFTMDFDAMLLRRLPRASSAAASASGGWSRCSTRMG